METISRNFITRLSNKDETFLQSTILIPRITPPSSCTAAWVAIRSNAIATRLEVCALAWFCVANRCLPQPRLVRGGTSVVELHVDLTESNSAYLPASQLRKRSSCEHVGELYSRFRWCPSDRTKEEIIDRHLMVEVLKAVNDMLGIHQ